LMESQMHCRLLHQSPCLICLDLHCRPPSSPIVVKGEHFTVVDEAHPVIFEAPLP
jgi:hypothetical protein